MIERLILKRVPPWETEIAFYVQHHGMPPLDARTFTICRWMYHGDLRPLAAALDDGPLDAPVIDMLTRLIREDRLRVTRGKRGRPSAPDQTGRSIAAALAYDAHPGKSDEAFNEIAEAAGMSEQSVRNAVTSWRAWRNARK